MAGLGETSRTMHLITPEFGLRQRIHKVITDLPLAPGKPIDFGVMNFCRTCKKCADFCPSKAIPFETEPNWTPLGPYQIAGVKIWHRNEPACNAYMRMAGMPVGCAICFAVCPLSQGKREAIYHNLMRTSISKAPIFNRFFRKMDDFLGYGYRDDPEKYWEMDLPPFGWEQT